MEFKQLPLRNNGLYSLSHKLRMQLDQLDTISCTRPKTHQDNLAEMAVLEMAALVVWVALVSAAMVRGALASAARD